MTSKEYFGMNEKQLVEYIGVKQKYDEFMLFKKLKNKKIEPVVTIEQLLSPLEHSILATESLVEENYFGRLRA